MKRILALDLGEKRVGVAISDPLLIFAQGLEVLKVRGKSDLLKKLSKYFETYQIDKVVLGNPLPKKGEESQATQRVKKFAKILASNYNVEVILWDERFTSQAARTWLKQGLGSKFNQKEIIDKISAQLILQSYLERLRNERLNKII